MTSSCDNDSGSGSGSGRVLLPTEMGGLSRGRSINESFPRKPYPTSPGGCSGNCCDDDCDCDWACACDCDDDGDCDVG